jgi:hypothetical protein
MPVLRYTTTDRQTKIKPKLSRKMPEVSVFQRSL